MPALAAARSATAVERLCALICEEMKLTSFAAGRPLDMDDIEALRDIAADTGEEVE